MIKMMTLKEQYKNKRFYQDGVEYDFRNITPEKLERIYNNNKNLRHLFEEKDVVEVTPEVILTPEEFDTMVKEIVKKPRKKK